MKSKILALALGLSSMPLMANGQSLDAEVIGPTPFRAAEAARWRDGYMTWRGRRIFEPDWRAFKADDGGVFVVDMKSIVGISPDGIVVRAVAYLVKGDDYDPNNLIFFAFNCKDMVEVVTHVTPERERPVEEQVRELACH